MRKFECPECGSTDTWKDGSDIWNCDSCGWCEQDDIDEMNEQGELEDEE